MPRIKAMQKYPPVDKLKAVILERKMAMHLEYSDLATAAGISPDSMRKLITTKHTDDWNPEIRRKVCRLMGFSMRTVIDLFEGDAG